MNKQIYDALGLSTEMVYGKGAVEASCRIFLRPTGQTIPEHDMDIVGFCGLMSVPKGAFVHMRDRGDKEYPMDELWEASLVLRPIRKFHGDVGVGDSYNGVLTGGKLNPEATGFKGQKWIMHWPVDEAVKAQLIEANKNAKPRK